MDALHTWAHSAPPDLSRVRLGSAPDSWGVWFADDPGQVPWPRFLDELASAGYEWLELGPYGYLPTDPKQLNDEVDRRGLRVSGGTVAGGLHLVGTWDTVLVETRRVATLVSATGARHVVFLPEMYRDVGDGSYVQPAGLDAEGWTRLVTAVSRLGRVVREEFGLSLEFHPHADSHVETQAEIERFLEGTDPESVSLCLDTGHVSYGGGDNVELIRRYPERIGYVHLKQVDPAVLSRVRAEGLSFAQAVQLGVMCEPPLGIPDMEPLLEALAGLDADLFAVVEQDLYPCEPDAPFPIAQRTRRYLGGCGLAPLPRRGPLGAGEEEAGA
ncbi:MAG: TIM barrel protein [Acidimicrobiales bacterium]